MNRPPVDRNPVLLVSLADFPPLARFRRRLLDLPIEELDSNWEDVLLPYGAALAGAAWNDPELTAWARRWADRQLAAGVQVIPQREDCAVPAKSGFFLNEYCGIWGGPLVLAALADSSPQSGDRDAIVTICDYVLTGGTRLDGGILAHGGWPDARRTAWVDTLFYSASVLAAGYRVTGNVAYADEAMKQCLLHARYLRDETTGCFFHDVDPATGRRSPSLWSRGNGWVMLSFADTLEACPADTAEWKNLLALYRSLAAGLLRLQHPCGLWRIVPECEESHLETSGSTMILAGLAAGVSAGWLDASVMQPVLRGWRELLEWIVPQTGALVGAQFPAGVGGWEIHKLSGLGERTYATGLFLRLVAQLKRSGAL